MAMLNVDGINVGYGRTQILWDVSLKVEEGEMVALVGPNGAGKTTTLRAIMGILPLISGKIEFKDQRIDNIPTHEVVKKGIAVVPEGRRVFPWMSVMDNLDIGAYQIRDRNQVKESLDLVFDLFPRLKERAKQQANTLSGGEQQMLVIGRALMSQPEFLMLDEPSLGLQPTIVADVFDSLVRLNRDRGLTILLVEQNVRKSLEITSTAYVLEEGKIRMSGDSKELLASEDIQKSYLGIK